MYKYVIFDIDGTLFNTSEGICECINFVLKENGYDTLSREETELFIGPPVMESFQKYCGMSSIDSKRMTNRYRELYVKEFIRKSKLYDGMFDLLKELKKNGIKIAVATLKTQKQVDILLENSNMQSFFDIVSGVQEKKNRKVELLEDIIKKWDVENKNKVVLVGDGILDAEGAFKADIKFIGVTYGFGIKEKKDLGEYNYVALCNTVMELRNALLS